MMDTKIHIDSEENIIWYQSKPIYEIAKRFFDLLLSILLLVVLLMDLLFIGITYTFSLIFLPMMTFSGS